MADAKTIVYALGFVFLPWLVFLLPGHQSGRVGILGTIADGVWIALQVAILLALTPRGHARLRTLLLALLVVSVNLLASFAYLYWHLGTSSNFTAQLTRIDAVYFAAGRFTTAGTGTLAATSSAARITQTVQMVVGAALVLFAFSAVVTRFTEWSGLPGAESTPSAHEEAAE
jgi:hypothetical protein